MTTKVDKPQNPEAETQTLPDATKAPTGAVLRLLLAATAPLFKRMITSAFSIKLNSLREEGLEEEDLPAEGLPDTHTLEQEEPQGAPIARFDTHQRIQHILMFTSFITLAATGLPQKFHTFGPSQAFIAILGGIEMTQTIHHFAAYVMLFDCLYHAVYIVRGVMLKKDINPLRMLPGPKDILDAVQMFLYFLGMSTKQPKFDRYSYLEKFDYWAVFWGIFIIGGSGIVLMFPVPITKVLPGQLIPVALAAHSDEAILAIGWIFIVHLFYAHLAPHIFPFNTSIFTGKVSRARYREEHPLDYRRRLIAERRVQVKAGTPVTLPVSGGAPEEAPAGDAVSEQGDPAPGGQEV
ncbi:MAG: hypothetical protein M1380_07795 [Chloroflexi bacterium]|nr:hypothetical protein [Chloroflexota bacterium]